MSGARGEESDEEDDDDAVVRTPQEKGFRLGRSSESEQRTKRMMSVEMEAGLASRNVHGTV
jgi:hypothetical protein